MKMKTIANLFRVIAVWMLTSPASVAPTLLGCAISAVIAMSPGLAQEAKKDISIDNFTFSPPELSVSAGTTITWTNRDDIPHSIVSKIGAFRSKALDTGDSYSLTFKDAGTFDYFCGLHPHMVGKVIVTP
jgi:amicyanin